MKARNRIKRGLAATASMLVLALLWAPAASAHDDDWDDDEYNYADPDDWYDDSGGADWCDYGHCSHGVAIPHYDGLRGYGGWRYVPAFGAHLWFPYVDVSWRPYYYGHWVRTSFGMTWVSHEPWGYMPHHYGRWVFVEPFGWGWVPGWEYAPAWVTWGVVDGYVGWAPCPPPGYRYPHYHRYRTSIHISTYGYGGSFGYHDSGLDFGFWIFVSDRDFYGRPVYRCALPPQRSLSFFKTKRLLPVGPRLDVGYVEKVSHRKIRPVAVDRSTKRVGDRSIEWYEPRGQKETIRGGQDVVKRAFVKPTEVERRVTERREKVRVERTRLEKPQSRTGERRPAATPNDQVKTRRDASPDTRKAPPPRKEQERSKVEERGKVQERSKAPEARKVQGPRKEQDARKAQEPRKAPKVEKNEGRRDEGAKQAAPAKERSKSERPSERPSKRPGK